jgi:YD repeat-containing protein
MLTKVANQQTTTYTWDFASQMVEVDFPTGDDVSLRYDGEGDRYRKEVGTATTKFLFTARRLSFELDGGDTVQAKYRRHKRGYVLAMRRGATPYTYHPDVASSTRALSDGSQGISDSYEYGFFGDTIASSGTTPNPYRFGGLVGYYDDGDTQLILSETGMWRTTMAGAVVPRSFLSGCTSQQKQEIREAWNRLCDPGVWPAWDTCLESGYPGSSACMRQRCNKCDADDVICNSNWEPRCLGKCGWGVPTGGLNCDIHVCAPQAFNPSRCGSLHDTIMHEWIHQCIGSVNFGASFDETQVIAWTWCCVQKALSAKPGLFPPGFL